MKDLLVLRAIEIDDCVIISEAFEKQGWNKPMSQYQSYYEYQVSGERDIIIAEFGGAFAGYLTIKWESDYQPFQKSSIPEIVDFNVLKKYQRKGIGSALMDESELRIKKVSDQAGIGFGLYKDYGAAQILYIRRGYIPDGQGISRDGIVLEYGSHMKVDDSIVLHLIKAL